MRFYAETVGLPEGADGLLRDLIHERIGLFYENGRCDTFLDKLAPLVIERSFESFLDYYYLLKYDAAADEEWLRVMDALSVQETYFWRESDQVRALVEVLVPEHFARAGASPLRIWSAACATGEEPLSIAMALDAAGWFERAAIEIRASDASRAALEKARCGLYRERSFRNLPEAMRERYFVAEQGAWRVRADLQARVRWEKANLMVREEAEPLAASHVVFCRNVFIYFSAAGIRRVLGLLSERMLSPGYLCVGVSESLLKLTTDFRLEEIGGAFIYVKEDERGRCRG